jgi:uncharacterized protein YecE (DUF72 family)
VHATATPSRGGAQESRQRADADIGHDHPTILVGTTSWTDRTLIESGRFYPPEVRTAEERLRYYASQFPIVEVDSSYYALPAARNSDLWVERTPAGFVFDVKAFRPLTGHQTAPEVFPKDLRERLGHTDKRNLYYRDLPKEVRDEIWERFRGALEILSQAGKLGVVVFQFAPWVTYGKKSLEHLRTCAEQLPGYRIAVEFRNESWFSESRRNEVLAFERDHGMAHVVVDEPQGFASSTPAVWGVTSPEVAVVRLHGRNRATWTKKGISAPERFNYLYSEDELKEFAGPVQQLAGQAERVHVLFNNCYGDQAQRNARQLRLLLEKMHRG